MNAEIKYYGAARNGFTLTQWSKKHICCEYRSARVSLR